MNTPSVNTLYYGDCLDIMSGFPDGYIDLICLDPPFNSNKKFNKENMFTAQAALKTKSRGTLLSSKEFTGATRQDLQSSVEHWAQQTLHDLGYRSIPYTEGYWLRDGTLKHYDWSNIVLTLELMEGM